MPLGGLLPYNNQIDFNAQAGLLAGPMPALPEFDFSPISVGGGGGGTASAGENYAPPGSQNSVHTPGSDGPAGNTNPTGNINMLGLRAGHDFVTRPLDVPYFPQDSGMNMGGGDLGDALNGAMLGGLAGPAGMLVGGLAGWALGGEGEDARPPQDPLNPSSGQENAPVEGLMPTTSRTGSNTGVTPAQAVAAYDIATGGGNLRDTDRWIRHR